MNTKRQTRTIRNRSFRTAFEAMERRQHMSASSVRTINSGGPDYSMVESNGTVYAISSDRPGGGPSQIWQATGGGTGNSKLLIDATAAGATVSSFDNLTVTGNGNVYFTANTTGGRQIFQLTSKGYKQLTSGSNVFYTKLTAAGNSLYFVEGNSQKVSTFNTDGTVRGFATGSVSKMFSAKDQLFYVLSGTSALYRSNGTSAGTYRVDGAVTINAATIFASNDFLFFGGSETNGNPSLYRTDGSNTAPTKIADDFAVRNGVPAAQVGTDVYFSGGFYNTSPSAAGQQLYKISSNGTLTKATNFGTSNGGGAPEGIAVIGNSIYMTAGDTEFITSAGTTDRELYRYDTTTGVTKLVTTNNDLYPIEINGGVLSSYYFVAAPTKADSRFGSRRLYRTSPTNDTVEEIGGLPSYLSGGVAKQDVAIVFGGSKGLFYSARNTEGNNADYDVYFVSTPFSYIDPVSHNLIVEATESSDTMSVAVDNNEIVLTLNGSTERWALADFGTINISLKGGDDKLTTSTAVTKNMDIKGDSGNDTMMGGSGNDSILGGSGRNLFYGQAGNDRLRGSNGYDWMNGGDDKDRLYGRGGSDNMRGGNGVDFIYGDDSTGPFGNDTLAGDQSADKLYGYGGDDLIVGGTQNDSLFGGDGNDSLQGQAGDDTLEGGAGEDELMGLDGDDVFFAADGSLDILNGGAGTDTATRDSSEKSIDLIEI